MTEDEQRVGHRPVMVSEVREGLAPRPGGTLVDATVGAGGHAAALLPALGPTGRLIGLDQDPDALAEASRRLSDLAAGGGSLAPFTLVKANFRELRSVLADLGVPAIDGLLFDLGVSSMQLDRPDRGFSFRAAGPLDMRMDPSAPTTAAQLVQELPEAELARLFFEYGEERWSRRIARRIVQRREREPFTTTEDLAQVVRAAARPAGGRTRGATAIDPATRVFQALRIAVNRELEVLEGALVDGAGLLRPGGRMAVLSYHSLEDRIAKRTFEWLAGRCRCPKELPACACGAQPRLQILTRKPLVPTEAERRANPRSRSAKLRLAERLPEAASEVPYQAGVPPPSSA